MSTIVGLDLAWGPNARTGVCVVVDGEVVVSASLRTDAEVLAIVRAHDAAVLLVAVDAPLVVPNAVGRRRAETLISRLYGGAHAGAHSSNRSIAAFVDGGRAARLAAALQLDPDPFGASRRRVIEVYPHPALVSLFGLARSLPYKAKRGRAVEARRAQFALLADLLEQLQGRKPALRLRGHPAWTALRAEIRRAIRGSNLDRLEDEIDAYVCAYVGVCFLAGQAIVVGSATEGYIVTPMDDARRARLAQLVADQRP